MVLFTLLSALVACVPSRSRRGDDDDSAEENENTGDDDDDDDDDVALPEVPNTDHCDPVSGWNDDWSELEVRVLELTNQARATGLDCAEMGVFPPAPPLVMQEHLRCSSRLHSVDMAERGYFEHTNPEGEGPGERMSAAGYPWTGFGENIGWGYPTAEGMMEGWITSPGHCSNLMTDWFTELGVGFFSQGNTITWTQNFGTR